MGILRWGLGAGILLKFPRWTSDDINTGVYLHFLLKPDKMTAKELKRDFPGGAVVKNLPANAGDTGSIPGLGRSHMPRSN